MISEKKLLRALGERIKFMRKAQNLTQEQLAELCDFDPTYISMLECGSRNAPFLTLCKLANKLECTVGQLVENVDVRGS